MKLLVLGAGGFASELAWHLEDSTVNHMHIKEFEEVLFVSQSESLNSFLGGYEVISELEVCNRVDPKQTLFGVAIGNLANRKKIATSYLEAGYQPATIISNNSRVSNSSTIGVGSIVCPGVTLMPNVNIGNHFHAHLNSYLAHDTKVGNYVTFLPGSMCSGRVIIGNEVLIGAGAVIREGSVEKPLLIGDGAVVGMGSVVLRDIPEASVVVGNPARTLRENRGSSDLC